MLIPSFPFTQQIPISDLWDQLGFLVTKILDGNSHVRFSQIKNKNSLSFHISYLPDAYLRVEYSSRRRTRAIEWRLHWGPCGLSIVFVWFFLFGFGCIVNMHFLLLFSYLLWILYIFVHALYNYLIHHALIFGKYTQAYKLGGGLMICPMTIGQDSDAWNTQLISECLLGNSGHMCLNYFL